MRRTIIALLTAALLALGVAGVASAAPIECSGNQEPVKTGDFWRCENAGGNLNESGDSSNPNGNPNFRR